MWRRVRFAVSISTRMETDSDWSSRETTETLSVVRPRASRPMPRNKRKHDLDFNRTDFLKNVSSPSTVILSVAEVWLSKIRVAHCSSTWKKTYTGALHRYFVLSGVGRNLLRLISGIATCRLPDAPPNVTTPVSIIVFRSRTVVGHAPRSQQCMTATPEIWFRMCMGFSVPAGLSTPHRESP